jgi:hypothetical protein
LLNGTPPKTPALSAEVPETSGEGMSILFQKMEKADE